MDPIFAMIHYPQIMNRYSYSLNDPVNFTDPDGRFVCGTACEDPPPPGGGGGGGGGGDFEVDKGGPGGGGGGGGPSFADCKKAAFTNAFADGRMPGINLQQFAQASLAASNTGADLALLLTTWYLESEFATTAKNGVESQGPDAGQIIAFGPLRLTRRIYNSSFNQGFTIDQIAGDRTSGTFTGSAVANLTVGGRYIAYLQGLARDAGLSGNDLLVEAGAAFRGGEGVIIGDRSTPGIERRRNQLYDKLPAFQKLVDCMK